VGWLSNFRRIERDISRRQVVCRRAREGEIRPALAMILGNRLADFERYASERGIDVANVRVAEVHDRIHWAALAVENPGRTVLVMGTPRVRTGARELVEKLVGEYRRRDIHLMQAMVGMGETTLRRLYQTSGFIDVGELIYMERKAKAVGLARPAGTFETYSTRNHGKFAETILASYRGSLDCPELNGVREIEDVIAGHKSVGVFDSTLWFLMREGTRFVGLLLMARTGPDVLEVVYLGLIATARGKDLGDELMRHVLAVAARESASRVTLAVDSRNEPAMKLYYRHGFKRVASKMAMVLDLRARKKLDPHVVHTPDNTVNNT
jgi:mycothiol synthase